MTKCPFCVSFNSHLILWLKRCALFKKCVGSIGDALLRKQHFQMSEKPLPLTPEFSVIIQVIQELLELYILIGLRRKTRETQIIVSKRKQNISSIVVEENVYRKWLNS